MTQELGDLVHCEHFLLFLNSATWTSAEAEVVGPNWELNVVKEGDNTVMPAGTLYWCATPTELPVNLKSV